ncbi:SGNH/GDSL hydrolase family protein [Flavivirga spongiicola]|uniref:SGNH/GDSL hydrolase family protein n=1 Tax=Flavivirga spongiicola TaxID=421621 RepID=A0ABU7XNN8_9FLAO|nr:SGNH/GDSL hydrolase family protein [Flavivirga sp. MEBiC05379]MDO5977376.1 SGNH/GDSL hydrolase family protein [Flavivirga sp. MEBiC05379]
MRYLKLLIVLLFFSVYVWGQSNGQLSLKNDESIVWVGNSITHQCRYSQYVENYLFTRFPDKRFDFHTAGVSGDKVADALARFDLDIARYKPDHITILLGMNDGSYKKFDKSTFETYQLGMLKLLSKIDSIGAKPIIMSPTMFDAKFASTTGWFPDQSYFPEYNGVLAYYSAWLREIAWEKDCLFVDLRTSLNQITSEKRKEYEGFTIVPDGIHPNPVGLAVMATDIIKQLFGEEPLSEIHLELVKNKEAISTIKGGIMSYLKISRKKVAFDFYPESLPWVIPEKAKEGINLAGINRINNEILSISGLARGSYTIYVDDVAIANSTARELTKGIDLSGDTTMSHYKQSLTIAALNQRRNKKLFQLRELWYHKKALSEKRKVVLVMPNDVKILKEIDKHKEVISNFSQKEKKILAQTHALQIQIYKNNKPIKRSYQIIKNK